MVQEHLSWTPAVVTEKALKGAVALITRQVLSQGLNILGGVLLARLLTPAEFGLYAIITFILTFLMAFGDVGLGASLIRQPTEPVVEDYRAIFTVQQGLVSAVVILFWFTASAIARAYHLPAHDVWLFRLVALSLLITSFQVVPSIQLERHLAFDRLAVIEVMQSLIYNVVAVGLAWHGTGAMSFALALIARSFIGAVLANIIGSWSIGWRWDWERVREHLRFGLPYQGISFVSLLKDSITPVFVGLLLGAGQVGYLNWAGMIAAYPVMILMVLQRIYLPAFSRMQAHPEHLCQFVEQILRATNILVAPLAVLTLILIRPLTHLVFGDKWLVAVPLFYFLWVANIFVASATPLMGLVNALGHSRIVFVFALIWMFGTWGLGAPLVVLYGAKGFAIANVGVQLTNLLFYRVAQSYVPFRMLSIVVPPWVWAAIIGFGAYLAQRAMPIVGFVTLAEYLATGVTIYGVGLLVLYPVDSRRMWVWIRRQRWRPASRS